MKRLIKALKSIDHRLLAIWLLIFTSFASLDLVATNSLPVTIIKLFGLFLCLTYVVIFYRSDLPLVLAFTATFTADVMLAINSSSLFGIFTFIIGQLLHFIRLKGIHLKSRKIAVVAAGIAAYFIIVAAFDKLAIYLLAIPYAVLLLLNLSLSLKWYLSSSSKKATFAFYGFAFFFLCDICVAIAFLAKIPFFDYLDWIFYYPSQVLLSISSKKVAKHFKTVIK